MTEAPDRGGEGGPHAGAGNVQYVSESVIAGALDAPPAAVFEAWTDPGLLARWWGPSGATVPVCSADPRAGGRYRIVMRGADGVEYPMKGVYLEVAHAERLVFTADLSEHPAAWHEAVAAAVQRAGGGPPTPVPVLVMEVTFEESRGGGTGLAIRTRFDSVARRDAFLAIGMNEGWSQSLERLAALLAKR